MEGNGESWISQYANENSFSGCPEWQNIKLDVIVHRRTHKNIPKILMDEMREAFLKSQEFLDYQTNTEQDKKVIQQRVVTQEEFEKLVTEGWEYLGTLPNGKIVIKNEQGSA